MSPALDGIIFKLWHSKLNHFQLLTSYDVTDGYNDVIRL